MTRPAPGPTRRPRVGIDAHLLSFAGSYRQAGVSRYIAELLRAFAGDTAPHDYVAFVGPARPPTDFFPAGSGSVRLVHSPLPTDRAPVRIAWEQALAPIAALRARLDLLHGPVNALPLAAPCRGVITIHDLAFLAHPDAFTPAKRRYLTAMTGLSARRAGRIIAVSAFTRDEIARRLGVPARKIAVVHNGVDGAFRPLPAEAVARFRAEQRLPERLILCVGTLEPRKNLDGLVRAYALLRQQAPDTPPLMLAGATGWGFQPLFGLVEELGLKEHVHFPGFVPQADLPLWYAAADVFVYPSLYEGFGLPPLEAMACGAAVIASSASSLPEVIGDAGLLVPPRDYGAIADALQRVLTDATLREDLRQRGIARAAEFTWQRTAEATASVYRDVLAGRRLTAAQNKVIEGQAA